MFISIENHRGGRGENLRQLRVPSRMLKHPVQLRSQLLVLSIREAAVQLCCAQSSSELSIKNVSARAGVSNGSIYQYFFGMEGIVASVYEDILMVNLGDRNRLARAEMQQVIEELARLDGMFDRSYGSTFYGPLVEAYACGRIIKALLIDDLTTWSAGAITKRPYWINLFSSSRDSWGLRRPA